MKPKLVFSDGTSIEFDAIEAALDYAQAPLCAPCYLLDKYGSFVSRFPYVGDLPYTGDDVYYEDWEDE